MLRIALCDDEERERKSASALLEKYLSLHPDLEGDITVFSSARELLAHMQVQGNFDLYLLDIIMPDKNGIELGLELRRLDNTGLIIYLTTSPDYAVDSYLTRAFFYLLKPLCQDKLFPVLDETVTHICRTKNDFLLVKTREGLQKLPVFSIVYGELVGRSIQYHLSDGTVIQSMTSRQSFRKEISPLLEHPQFALCSVSFVVNLAYIERVERNCLTLKEGSRLPLTRAFREEVKECWLDYHLKGDENHAG